MRSAEGCESVPSRREVKVASADSACRAARATSSSFFSSEWPARIWLWLIQAERIASTEAFSACASARISRAVRAVTAATQIITSGKTTPTTVITSAAVSSPVAERLADFGTKSQNSATMPSQSRLRISASHSARLVRAAGTTTGRSAAPGSEVLRSAPGSVISPTSPLARQRKRTERIS